MKEKIGKSKKVAVALSGGVDSAVSAALLKDQGFEVVCVHMVCWEEAGSGCASNESRVDAAKVAGHLGLPILAWDFTKEYKERVINYFYSEYELGRTPNPDVMCNKEIKFGLFFEKAFKELNVDFIATGHYARISPPCKNGKYALLKGVDLSKDQSYFLYLLTQRHLSRTLFPVGGLKKTQVRELAKKYKLPVWDKPDSQGICFVGEINIRKFLEERIKPEKGKILDVSGKVMGEHDGVWFYTIGQRHGFTIGAGRLEEGEKDKNPKPRYVLSKDIAKNTITVGSREYAMSNKFEISDLHWISQTGVKPGLEARLRHLGELYPVEEVIPFGENLRVELSKKAFGIAPGQSAVFYCKEEVLGGGVIV